MDQVDTPIIAKDENKPPKPKTNILDYLFAEATLLRLDQLHSRDAIFMSCQIYLKQSELLKTYLL